MQTTQTARKDQPQHKAGQERQFQVADAFLTQTNLHQWFMAIGDEHPQHAAGVNIYNQKIVQIEKKVCRYVACNCCSITPPLNHYKTSYLLRKNIRNISVSDALRCCGCSLAGRASK